MIRVDEEGIPKIIQSMSFHYCDTYVRIYTFNEILYEIPIFKLSKAPNIYRGTPEDCLDIEKVFNRLFLKRYKK